MFSLGSFMSWFAIDVECTECGQKSDVLTDRETGGNWEILHDCPICHALASAKRIMSAPRSMKLSLPDGTKRGGAFEVMKEAAKLELAAANEIKPARKRELEKAAQETKKAAKRERTTGSKSPLK